MVELIYIPGLNNYDDDRVHIGPFTFFRMHDVLAQHLEKYSVKLTPIYPAKQNLHKKSEELARKISLEENKVIILGHSTGGIIARSFLKSPELRKKIAGIITFGSPHQGSHLADLAQKLATSESARIKLLKFFGYDVTKNLEFIADLSAKNLKSFFAEEPSMAEIPVYSLVCTKQHRKLPFVFRLLYSYSGENIDFSTDGIVAQASQTWGKTLGPFDLDHLAQIGFFKHLINPRHKRHSLAEFDRLIKTIANIAQEIHCHH